MHRAAILTLWACAEKGSSPQEIGAEPVPDPSPYEYSTPEDAEATYDQAAVEASLQEVFDQLLWLNAAPLVERYEAVMGAAEAGCPEWYEVDGSSFWYADCDTSADPPAHFEGYVFDTAYSCVDLFENGGYWMAQSIAGAATLDGGQGDALMVGGQLYLGTGKSPSDCSAACGADCACAMACEAEVDYWVSGIFGGFDWSGEGEGSWLDEGVTPSLLMYGAYYTPTGGRYTYGDGTVGGLSEQTTAAQVSDLTYGDALIGFPCEEEPAGSVSIRDLQGNWWQVVFDVDPDDWDVTRAACDGCGTAYHNGVEVGQACADPSALIDWEVTPW